MKRWTSVISVTGAWTMKRYRARSNIPNTNHRNGSATSANSRLATPERPSWLRRMLLNANNITGGEIGDGKQERRIGQRGAQLYDVRWAGVCRRRRSGCQGRQ